MKKNYLLNYIRIIRHVIYYNIISQIKKRHNLANMAHRLGIKKQYKARRYDKDIMLLQLKELADKL